MRSAQTCGARAAVDEPIADLDLASEQKRFRQRLGPPAFLAFVSNSTSNMDVVIITQIMIVICSDT